MGRDGPEHPCWHGDQGSASSSFLETPAPVGPWEGCGALKGTGWDWCYLGLVLFGVEQRVPG